MSIKETRYIEFSNVNKKARDSILKNILVLSDVFYNGSTLVVIVSIDLKNRNRVKSFIDFFKEYSQYLPIFTNGGGNIGQD